MSALRCPEHAGVELDWSCPACLQALAAAHATAQLCALDASLATIYRGTAGAVSRALQRPDEAPHDRHTP